MGKYNFKKNQDTFITVSFKFIKFFQMIESSSDLNNKAQNLIFSSSSKTPGGCCGIITEGKEL